MSITQNQYFQRAAELEALAAQVSDSTVQTSYLKAAQGFRDMANLAGVSQMESDEEAIRLAERMVGKASGAQGASPENPDNTKE